MTEPSDTLAAKSRNSDNGLTLPVMAVQLTAFCSMSRRLRKGQGADDLPSRLRLHWLKREAKLLRPFVRRVRSRGRQESGE